MQSKGHVSNCIDLDSAKLSCKGKRRATERGSCSNLPKLHCPKVNEQVRSCEDNERVAVGLVSASVEVQVEVKRPLQVHNIRDNEVQVNEEVEVVDLEMRVSTNEWCNAVDQKFG